MDFHSLLVKNFVEFHHLLRRLQYFSLYIFQNTLELHHFEHGDGIIFDFVDEEDFIKLFSGFLCHNRKFGFC